VRLPPLNALRAFEAAARHGSFTRAAEELNVSAGAVSRHVKILEAYFGVALFERLAQGLKSTEAANELLPKVTASFEAIARAAAEVGGPEPVITEPVVKVIASPTFANRCLVPRLPAFKERRPETVVSVSVLISDIEEFVAGDHDCGMATFHAPEWPAEMRVERIRGEALTPFCAPSLLAGRKADPTPEDLTSLPLLHIAACRTDWPNWLALNGCSKRVALGAGPTLETGELAIRAAVEGLGVIVMDRYLVERELLSGQLVDLFPMSRPVDNGYFFFCRRERWDEAEIAAIRDWFRSEFGDSDPG
jgi:LysR family glycine cleavage system transcriptional activator